MVAINNVLIFLGSESLYSDLSSQMTRDYGCIERQKRKLVSSSWDQRNTARPVRYSRALLGSSRGFQAGLVQGRQGSDAVWNQKHPADQTSKKSKASAVTVSMVNNPNSNRGNMSECIQTPIWS